MMFKKKQIRYSDSFYVGRKNNFEFTYSTYGYKWYCVVEHTKKDIRFNTLWQNITFDTREDVEKWCETFDYKKYDCIGDDVNNQ